MKMIRIYMYLSVFLFGPPVVCNSQGPNFELLKVMRRIDIWLTLTGKNDRLQKE